MSTQNEKMSILTFQDLVVLKQFLEKGFRENFFSQQEIPGAELELQKLETIINQVIEKNKEMLVTTSE